MGLIITIHICSGLVSPIKIQDTKGEGIAVDWVNKRLFWIDIILKVLNK